MKTLRKPYVVKPPKIRYFRHLFMDISKHASEIIDFYIYLDGVRISRKKLLEQFFRVYRLFLYSLPNTSSTFKHYYSN